MKKNKKIVKTISCVLSFIIMFMSMFVIFISADSTEPVYCVSDHFSKLKYNHNGVRKYRVPPNEIGTCTHVAMSMLLSFYDFYWHDDFVPTMYLLDGTTCEMGWENGVYNSTTHRVIETINAYPEATAWDYWEGNGFDFESFAEYNQFYYLQPYLMGIAESETLSGAVGIVGMLDFQVVRVLEEYLSMMGLSPENGVEVHIEYGFPTPSNLNASRETLFDTMKNQIDNGNPVMFLGLDNIDILPELIDGDEWGIYAHAMVAYDVVQKDGKEDILLHTGWSDTDRGTSFDDKIDDDVQYYNSTPYTKLNSAIWIEIDEDKLSHECTDKYYDVVTGYSFCACEIYCGTHPAGEHKDDYISYTSSGHIKVCLRCGEEISESHNTTSVPYTNEFHKDICACGYVRTIRHATAHFTGTTGKCMVCGATVTIKGPTIEFNSIGDNNNSTNYVFNNGIQYITENGSYLSSNGIIVLSDADYELYLSGELDLYELIDSECCIE